MPLSPEEFKRVRHVLRESLTLESIRPLGQTKYGGYTATVASHFEKYVYDIEASVEPVKDQLDVCIRCNAFAFSVEQDAVIFLNALGEKRHPIFGYVDGVVAYAWGFVAYRVFHFPRLRLIIDKAGGRTQSEIIEILHLAKVRFDDVLPVFERASQGGPELSIAKDQITLACQASIGGCAH